jgi:hypothetical protein
LEAVRCLSPNAAASPKDRCRWNVMSWGYRELCAAARRDTMRPAASVAARNIRYAIDMAQFPRGARQHCRSEINNSTTAFFA